MDYDILPSNENTVVENRRYLNPNLVVDETNTFIDNLRNTQQGNMEQISTQTERLGTDIPSVQGGLTGSGSYWSSRYVTPQTASVVSNLRSAAQASALNQALANEEAMWKKRYQDAYNSYQKRAWSNSKSGSSDYSSLLKKLGIDVNEGESGDGTVSENDNTGRGKYVPVTDFVGDYLSEDGNQWWMLGSLMKTDELNLTDRGMKNLKSGETMTKNGVTYMYLENDQFPNGRWFRANPSAGPGTYSPYAGVNNE